MRPPCTVKKVRARARCTPSVMLTSVTTSSADAPPPNYNPKAHDWVFIVDTARCIGCGRCVRACKEENRVPMDPRFNRTWIERYVQTGDGELQEGQIWESLQPVANERLGEILFRPLRHMLVGRVFEAANSKAPAVSNRHVYGDSINKF